MPRDQSCGSTSRINTYVKVKSTGAVKLEVGWAKQWQWEVVEVEVVTADEQH